MPAYVIVDVDVRDPERCQRYKELAPPAVAHYGGRFLACGGATEVLEGDWVPRRLVVLEFESLEQARRWDDSSEYAAGARAAAGSDCLDDGRRRRTLVAGRAGESRHGEAGGPTSLPQLAARRFLARPRSSVPSSAPASARRPA